MIKPLVAVFDLYIMLMGLLSMFVTAPLIWNASPNAYFGVFAILGVWFTIIAIVTASVIAAHEAAKPREKHDV